MDKPTFTSELCIVGMPLTTTYHTVLVEVYMGKRKLAVGTGAS